MFHLEAALRVSVLAIALSHTEAWSCWNLLRLRGYLTSHSRVIRPPLLTDMVHASLQESFVSKDS